MKNFRITKLLAIMALVLAFGGAMTLSAQAVPTLDFGMIAPTPGTIQYSGTGVVGDAALQGIDIQVDQVIGENVPFNDFVVLPITNGVLNFTTGAFSGSAPGQWNFASGGTITVSGFIDFDGAGPNAPVFGTWLSGTLSSATVQTISSQFGLQLTVAGFNDIKDPNLLAYYFGANFDPNTNFVGGFHIDFNTLGTAPNGFTSTVLGSGDITNQVPVPPAVLLMGSGLLGLVGMGWRRRKS